MKEAEKLIEELRSLVGKTDTNSRRRFEEIAQWFSKNNSVENQKLLSDFIDNGIDKMEEEIGTIMKCIKQETSIGS